MEIFVTLLVQLINVFINTIIYLIFMLNNYQSLWNLKDANLTNICQFCDIKCAVGKCTVGADSSKCTSCPDNLFLNIDY